MLELTTIAADARSRDDAHLLLGKGVPSGAWEPNVRAPAVVADADTGEPVLAVGRFPEPLGPLRRAFRSFPMGTTHRRGGAGFGNRSTTFGYVSRDIIKMRDGCRACAAAAAAPDQHATIVAAAAPMATLMSSLLPLRAGRDASRASDVVLADWRLPGSPWTSGVLNDTSPLPYHYDRNNLDTWSAMVVVRRGVDGGYLHVPEYDLVVDCRDGDVVFFPGWHFLHGVTPLRRTAKDGYRFSAVFYTVSRMTDCLPPAEEMAWARAHRTAREADLRNADARLTP